MLDGGGPGRSQYLVICLQGGCGFIATSLGHTQFLLSLLQFEVRPSRCDRLVAAIAGNRRMVLLLQVGPRAELKRGLLFRPRVCVAVSCRGLRR